MTIPKRIEVCEHTDERAGRTDRWWFPHDPKRGRAVKGGIFVREDEVKILLNGLRAIQARSSVNDEDWWIAKESLEAYEE